MQNTNHRYLVPIVGGFNKYYEVIAPNKTIACMIAKGEVRPEIKVKSNIIIDLGVCSINFKGEQKL